MSSKKYKKEEDKSEGIDTELMFFLDNFDKNTYSLLSNKSGDSHYQPIPPFGVQPESETVLGQETSDLENVLTNKPPDITKFIEKEKDQKLFENFSEPVIKPFRETFAANNGTNFCKKDQSFVMDSGDFNKFGNFETANISSSQKFETEVIQPAVNKTSQYKNFDEFVQSEMIKKEQRAQKSRDARLKKKIQVQKLEDEVDHLQKTIKDIIKRKRQNEEKQDMGSKKRKTAHFSQQKDPSIVIDVNEIKTVCERSENLANERLTKALYYLESVSECLLPGNQVKFLLWFFTQKKEFYSKELSKSLFKGVEIPFDKIENSLPRRKMFENDKAKIEQLIKELIGLQEKIKTHFVGVSSLANKIRSVLTSVQMMRFFRWMKTDECRETMSEISSNSLFTNPVLPPSDPEE